jgi:TetR/AcrR family transcriptional regulator, mexJK operon transcriptional repressor
VNSVWTRAGQPAAGSGDAAVDPRIARSRAVIVAAALEHFLRNGYVGTSVDDIAAEARVSKRTVYNIFGGKEQLFREIMADALAVAEQFSTDVVTALADADDVEAELRAAAREIVRTVLSPRVVRLRRLLIGEAERFPELAKQYYQRAPDRVMDALAEAMTHLTERGLLVTGNPRLAAEHFAFLVLGAPLDRALFTAGDPEPSADEIDREVETRVREGVLVFLCAYGARR